MNRKLLEMRKPSGRHHQPNHGFFSQSPLSAYRPQKLGFVTYFAYYGHTKVDRKVLLANTCCLSVKCLATGPGKHNGRVRTMAGRHNGHS